MFFPETLLYWMQDLPLGQPLDRRHLRTISLHGQKRAGLHRFAIEMHSTGPTQTGLTPNVRARQPQHITQVVHQE